VIHSETDWLLSITESNNSSQKPPGTNLSVEQLNAIDILVQGKTDQETARSVGVARETVTRWRNDNPYFAAELNKQRKLIWGTNQDRLRSLTTKAVDTIETALDAGDSKAAVEVLKAVGLYGQVKPPGGPVDAELVMWEKAKEWALAELSKKGPSADPLLDILSRDADVARLTRHRMEELTESQADKSRNKAE
jgi:hypothetical protein